ncbi:MAG: NYN domain-containing protein [Phycisphaerales bacterium]
MLLVDAYNVIGARWRLPRDQRDLDVPGLIAWIQRSPRFGRRRGRIVCDGRPGPGWDRANLLETSGGLIWTRIGPTEVVFSGPGREADDVIEDTLARAKGVAILMVSSDRRLIRAARAARAEQIGNGAFLDALAADTRDQDHPERPAFATDVPLSGASIAHWMRAFGFDPSQAAPRAPKPQATPEPPRREPERSEPGSAKPGRDAPAREGLGERLNLSLPEPETRPAPQVERAPEPVPDDGLEHDVLDPLLAEAFEEWRGRLDPDDLDMDRWIDGVTPL